MTQQDDWKRIHALECALRELLEAARRAPVGPGAEPWFVDGAAVDNARTVLNTPRIPPPTLTHEQRAALDALEDVCQCAQAWLTQRNPSIATALRIALAEMLGAGFQMRGADAGRAFKRGEG